MAQPEQLGIKWWKVCPVCRWAAKTKGAIGSSENALEQCPNCNNPRLGVEIDDNVFEERRYDLRVRNSRGQAIADEVRQNAGRPPAPPDVQDNSNQGHQYGDEGPPFDEDGNARRQPRITPVENLVDPGEI